MSTYILINNFGELWRVPIGSGGIIVCPEGRYDKFMFNITLSYKRCRVLEYINPTKYYTTINSTQFDLMRKRGYKIYVRKNQ